MATHSTNLVFLERHILPAQKRSKIQPFDLCIKWLTIFPNHYPTTKAPDDIKTICLRIALRWCRALAPMLAHPVPLLAVFAAVLGTLAACAKSQLVTQLLAAVAPTQHHASTMSLQGCFHRQAAKQE